MGYTVRINERILGGGIIQDPTTGRQQVMRQGYGILPDLSYAVNTGTGAGNANVWYAGIRTLAATTYDLLDLYGGLTDPFGATINFTAIRRVLIALSAPDGTASLRVGPQNQTHAFPGPFLGGVGATVYETILDELDWKNPFAGWAVANGSTDILAIYNPGATSVQYGIWIVGEQ